MSIPGNADTSSPQTVACDRCRGQKLRCVWEPSSRVCRRCTRAKAECVVSSPKPTGRPPRKPHAGSFGRGNAGLSDGNDGSVTVGRRSTTYDLGLTSPDWWSISDDLENLPTDQQLGHFQADESFCGGLNGFQKPEEIGVACYGSTAVGGFGELAVDEDSSATNVALGRGEFSLSIQHRSTPDVDGKRSTEEIVECITQLCELNRALSEYHPLVTSRKSSVGDGNRPTPSNIGAYDCCIEETDGKTNLDLSCLHIGQLLSLASQLGTISGRLGTQSSATHAFSHGDVSRVMASSERPGATLEQAGHHLGLGCYYSLEYNFTHVLKVLHRAKDGQSPLLASPLLQAGAPLLSIDGFVLDGNREMQIELAIHACEKILCTTRRSVMSSPPEVID